jgi:hypothetical protein
MCWYANWLILYDFDDICNNSYIIIYIDECRFRLKAGGKSNGHVARIAEQSPLAGWIIVQGVD